MRLILSAIFFFLSTYLEGFTEIKTQFPFSKEPIDVVIPSTEKDLDTLDLCIEGIKKNGRNIGRVIVVSKNKLSDEAEWYPEEAYPFAYEDVADALAHGSSYLRKKMLRIGSRTGWYYQQLLKFYAPLVIPDISSNVLILDSDTIFLNPVTFLNGKNGGMYNPGTEYNPYYFTHAKLLIPGFYKLFPEYSGVSHHMIFQRPVIEELFNLVESHHLKPFWKVFCELVEAKCLRFSGASEYEIYFNYVFSRSNQVSIRKLNWKNIQKFAEIPILKNQGFHYVSLHSYDRMGE